MTIITHRSDALVEHLLGATLGAMELFSVPLGAARVDVLGVDADFCRLPRLHP